MRKPKQSVFPAATPLSDAERALVAFVKIAPNDEVSALVEERKRSIAPIQIDSIKITPLQSDGAQ
jgi:hypothetical protein